MRSDLRNNFVLASLLGVSLFVVMLLLFSRISLKENLDKEKTNAEAALSEKLSLDKKLEMLKNGLISANKENLELTEKVKLNADKINSDEKEINRLKKNGVENTKLHRKIKDLESSNTKMNAEIENLNNTINKLRDENTQLYSELGIIKQQNEELEISLKEYKTLTGDNYGFIACKRKNEKITIKARQARTLTLSFYVPYETSADITCKLVLPDGKEIAGLNNNQFSFSKSKTTVSGTLATSSKIDLAKGKGQKMEVKYTPTDKLQKGTYSLLVFNGTSYLGSSQIRLR